ncbi:MAG: glycosyltransferase family 2 protein [Pirellulales bacterium]
MSEYPVNVVPAPMAATIRPPRTRAAGTSGDGYATAQEAAGTVAPQDGVDTLLTVIVPVYNEAATVDELLRRVVGVALDLQVIVVDDGSTDGTTTILERWEGHPLVELLAHACNRGKGAAIRTALEQVRGRYTIVQDADLEYDPADYARLLQPLLAGDADAVYGSRYVKPASVGNARPTNARAAAGRPPWSVFRAGVCALNLATRRLYGARLTDEATCYKVFPTEALRAMRLVCERFEFCPEVTAKACRMGLRIAEVPVRYSPRGMAEGKKIRWRDGVEALVTLWRWRKWEPGRR